MKELSIEQKAKAYDEALKYGRYLIDTRCKEGSDDSFHRSDLEKMFSELAESEDEKIRKAILWCIRTVELELGCKDVEGLAVAKLKSWLEKQREQKFAWSENDEKIYNRIYDLIHNAAFQNCDVDEDGKELGEYAKITNWFKSIKNRVQPQHKVEPKFEVGDWVVNTITNNVEQIIKVISNEYICSGNLIVSFDNQHLLRKWTVKDAKDGDILITITDKAPFIFKGFLDKFHPDCPVAYGGITSENTFDISSGIGWRDDDDIKPATEEQRDLLFQKMKEAGYEWDAEKKELKKIEQKPDALSEDDGRIMKEIIQFFIDASNSKTRVITSETFVKWAKFLKQKEQKVDWSEEDEENRLNANVAFYDYFDDGYAEKLCSWLKELKYIVG